MMRSREKIAAAVLLATLLPCVTATGQGALPDKDFQFHAIVPLGLDAVEVGPAKKMITLIGSAESREFEGMRRTASGPRPHLVSSTGAPVRFYPERVKFRVTATSRGKPLDVAPMPISSAQSPDELLRTLHFQLKVFRGIESRLLPPQSVEMIGVPADVPYYERIYRIWFRLDRVPATDRLILEVLDKDGERVSRFHLELL